MGRLIMTNFRPYPSKEELSKYLDYNPEQGNLVWKVDVSLRARKGMIAGSLAKAGYMQIRLNNRTLKSHRVIWILHHGYDPVGYAIVHEDQDNSNNKIDNLLMLTTSEVKRRSDARRRFNNQDNLDE